MKAIYTILLVNSVILYHFLQECDGNSVKLVPSPVALVKEGETLHIQCDYSGSSNPDFINWYLNGDLNGLVINARTCKFQAKPKLFEPYHLNQSCSRNNFTLSIVNISNTRDNGSKWECDTTMFGMHPPAKASTTIKVIKAETSSDKGNEGFSTAIKILIIIGVIAVIAVVIVVVLRHILPKIRKNRYSKKHAPKQEVIFEMKQHHINQDNPAEESKPGEHSSVMEIVDKRQDS